MIINSIAFAKCEPSVLGCSETDEVSLTGFMVIYAFMKGKPSPEEFVDLVGIFDIITNLVVDDSCRCDQSIQEYSEFEIMKT